MEEVIRHESCMCLIYCSVNITEYLCYIMRVLFFFFFFFFFSSRRRHTRLTCDWSSDVCSSDLSLPSVKATPGTMPTVTIPAAKEPAKLITKTLIKGTGAPVAKGDEVVTQYVGVNWRTKKVFDSSWSRKQPFGFQLDATPEQIIPGWDKGLAGVPAGSRVMLIIPPADGYGKTGNAQAGIKGTDDLVFVVDVLAGVK